MAKQWPHAPLHLFNHMGTYMVTGATYERTHFFRQPKHLDFLQNLLFELAQKYGWFLEAWAIFSNHYHIVAQSPTDPETLQKFVTHLHAVSARYLNKEENQPGRKIWYQYWDSKITFSGSYLARLKYVMNNPEKHKLVYDSREYQWCSASWFTQNASKSHYASVESVKIDSVNILDDF